MDDANVAKDRKHFWFICCISNPVRYHSRFNLYRAFQKHIVGDLKANLLTVECAHGGRQHYVTGKDINTSQEIHVQVQNNSSMFLKESLLNIALRHLPKSTKYVCWIDCDVEFARKDIVDATIHALQTHRVVSPWQNCIDHGATGEVMEVHSSFGWCHFTGQRYSPPSTQMPKYPAPFAHPGFACCFHYQDLMRMGGFIDIGIVGASDHHMSSAILGRVGDSWHGEVHENYKQILTNWQDRAQHVFKRNVGFVPGTIHHSFHGHKVNRGYQSRWHVLIDNCFDPLKDVVKNLDGVWEFVDHGPRAWALRDSVHRYMTARQEDTKIHP